MVPGSAACQRGTLGCRLGTPNGSASGTPIHPADEDEMGQLQPGIPHNPAKYRPGEEAARVPGIHPGA